MKPDANPLLDFSGLPRFSAVGPEHVGPAIDLLLADGRATVARLTDPVTPATWHEFVEPLEDVNERLARAWGIVAHLHGVLDSPPLRDAYNASQPKVVQYWTELGHNEALFAKYKALRAGEEYSRLDAAQRRIIDNELRDFRLSGAELPADQKKRFARISEELAGLATRFAENVLDATNAFAMYLEDHDALAGIPDDVLESARAAAERDGKPGWKLTLQAPCYVPVMQYAENRILRERLYHAYSTRASEQYGKALSEAERYAVRSGAAPGASDLEERAGKWDNTPLIARILELRKEAARLLGYASHAEVSLVPKMAESPGEVLAFLDDLAEKSMPFARRDFAELSEFAAAELGLTELAAWDVAFASEALRKKRYAYSEREVKQYFPESKVLEGMFRVVQTLYGIRIEPDTAETWHPDVRFFRICDEDGALIGQFYLDLHARETKRGGAWMDDAMARRRKGSALQTPVAYLVCNFPGAVGSKPPLFTHDDVITLFHEFGHGLHHLLTRVDHLGVSGIHGVEWDAVELPSQFMENYCWEWEVLRHMTAHVDTGAPLPLELFDKMTAAKNFQAGMYMVRQLEFALFDMHLYHDFDVQGARTPLDLLDEVRRKVAVIVPPAYHRLPNSFSHIFGGGYGAGYYSYKWAEVLSADAYSLFEENGVLDTGTGRRFRDEVLAVGGSRPALESFELFRGRKPKVDALLKHNGMIAA